MYVCTYVYECFSHSEACKWVKKSCISAVKTLEIISMDSVNGLFYFDTAEMKCWKPFVLTLRIIINF